MLYVAALSIIVFPSLDLSVEVSEQLQLGQGLALAHMSWPGTRAEIISIVWPQS